MISNVNESKRLRTINEHYSQLELKLRKKSASGIKINVLIYEPSSNTSKLSLIKAFSQNNLFNTLVFSHDTSNVSINNYEKIGAKVIYGGDVYETCLLKGIDILFIDSPHHYFSFHKPSFDFYTKIPDSVFEKTLLCYVPYAYICVKDEHSCNDHIHRYCWKFFIESLFHYKKAIAFKDRIDNVVLTGHPYLDGYYSDYLIENNRIHDLTILWAPHHNKVFYNNVSLVEQESVLRELIVKNENVRVIFRPHPNLFGALNSEMHMNSDDYNTLMTLDEAKRMKAFWENHDRVDCSYKGSIVEFFEAADLIITNCGGFQMEMLHSNRVLVNLINQKLLNRQLKNFQKYCYLPNDKVEFNTILNTYLTKRGKNRTHRDEINQYLPDEGKAGETIVEHICNFIN